MNILNRYTRKVLLRNKLRTAVTIIGIILSVAMFTAVTTSVSSATHFMLEMEIEGAGAWEAAFTDLNSGQLKGILNEDSVKSGTILERIGYAEVGSSNEEKPYVYVTGITKDFTDYIAMNLVEGRMPENSSELLISKHLSTNGGVDWKVGDTITLEVGQRYWEDTLLTQKDVFYHEDENGPAEELRNTVTKTYTIVGICERMNYSVEGYSAPGYMVFTLSGGTPQEGDLYIKFADVKKAFDVKRDLCKKYADGDISDIHSVMHYALLRYQGVNGEGGTVVGLLRGFSIILMIIIMFGSISLIYNAFSISVSERTKQFGILKSIGATRKQITGTVLYEALFLCLIGVPLGLLSGIAGMAVTFHLLQNSMSTLGLNTNVVFGIYVTPVAVLAAAGIGIVTVLISAWIPARKAMHLSAMEAIRQSGDVKIPARRVKTSKLTYKLFGFEGMIASKNFKRNKKKYRITVMSLFVSIVLFISASSFSDYLLKAFTMEIDEQKYDIFYENLGGVSGEEAEELYQMLSGAPGVKDKTYFVTLPYNQWIDLSTEHFSPKYKEIGDKNEEGEYEFLVNALGDVSLVFVQDEAYREYLEANGYDAEKYMDTENPVALVYDYQIGTAYDESGLGGRNYEYTIFDEGAYPFQCSIARKENILSEDMTDGAGEEADETDEENDDIYSGESTEVTVTEKTIMENTITLGGVTKVRPLFNTFGSTNIMYPLSAMENVMGEQEGTSIFMYFTSSNHRDTYEKMEQLLSENHIGANSSNENYYFSGIYDITENQESSRALILILNVFSYGFIVLISLIALANVFNTISTNIMLRRREFAMLKSIGMTKKSFGRMMDFECLIYGTKALLYGLPVSVVIAYEIYRMVDANIILPFYIPWYSIVISVGSVFFVVFATMLYSMNKIQKGNTVDELKRENI